MKFTLLLILLFAPTLQAQICWNEDYCSGFTPIVPYAFVTPAVPPVSPRRPPGSLHSAPPITVGVTPSDSGPTTIMRFPEQGMTHIIQQGKVTTCFTIGVNTVVCQ
jgi:hypothetical protein